MVYKNQDFLQDKNLRLKDSGSAVTADAAATVDGSTATLDLGAAFFAGNLVVDVSAIDVSSSDEIYLLKLIGSNSSSFSSGIAVLGCLALGDTVGLGAGADVDNGTGRYVMPFHNEKGGTGTVYRYLRLYADVGGTSPSITYTAFVAKN